MSSQWKRMFIFLFLLFLLFLFINYFHLLYQARNIIPLDIPLCGVLGKLGNSLNSFPSYFYSKEKLLEENGHLEQEVNKLLSEKEKLGYLEQENQDLKKLLGIKNSKKFQYIIGQVIMRNVSDNYIFINKGISDGVVEGMAVVSPDLALLGKVKASFKSYSIVSLVFQKGNVFDVKGPDDTYGIAQGGGSERIVVNNIAQEKKINEGDLFFTSPYSEVYPPSLLVGKVIKVERIDVKPFQSAILKPVFNINRLKNIFLIK